MKIIQKSNDGSSRSYRVEFENLTEASLVDDAIYAQVEPYNYGGHVIRRNAEYIDFIVYID